MYGPDVFVVWAVVRRYVDGYDAQGCMKIRGKILVSDVDFEKIDRRTPAHGDGRLRWQHRCDRARCH